ncbi:tetratricopeptide repeat protein [Microvirga calopogonii]|uniref:tetratricopeptide repeat protein n=1 Tax=Microvirga calopogonii TaxID=2078013 RepID=UPI000E0DAA75|nr:tetratricopeptide repeat protein [Microvirga calopogonii]
MESKRFLRILDKSFAFPISAEEERCHFFCSAGRGDQLRRTEMAQAGMYFWEEAMPKDRDCIGLSRLPLAALFTRWSLGLSLQKLKHTSPHTVRFYLIRGRILFSVGRHDQAIDDFRNALRLNWRHEKAAFWLNKATRTIPQTGGTRSLT